MLATLCFHCLSILLGMLFLQIKIDFYLDGCSGLSRRCPTMSHAQSKRTIHRFTPTSFRAPRAICLYIECGRVAYSSLAGPGGKIYMVVDRSPRKRLQTLTSQPISIGLVRPEWVGCCPSWVGIQKSCARNIVGWTILAVV